MAYPPKVFPPLGGTARLRGRAPLSASLEEDWMRASLLDKDLGAQYINCEFRQDQSL
jgi:hypothetical protein